jgi:hypothetical protein
VVCDWPAQCGSAAQSDREVQAANLTNKIETLEVTILVYQSDIRDLEAKIKTPEATGMPVDTLSRIVLLDELRRKQGDLRLASRLRYQNMALFGQSTRREAP